MIHPSAVVGGTQALTADDVLSLERADHTVEIERPRRRGPITLLRFI